MWFLSLTSFLLLVGEVCAQQAAIQLDAMIQRGMKDWNIPGLSVVAVHHGEIAFMKSYGVSDLTTGELVDDKTMGMMGSTTKAVTALAMAMLVDEGKVGWDDHVIHHLPEFQLSDPYLTRELRIRDLLCHRAGIGNTDMLWVSGMSADSVLHQMRYAPVSYSLRSDYIYQNVMYLAAGKVIERVSESSWADFIKARIFDPLQMKRTVPLANMIHERGNFMAPHHWIDGKVTPIMQVTAEQVAPAGDIWGSIEDMGKWIRFLLDSTKVNGERLVSVRNFGELFQPHTIIPPGKMYPTTKLTNPHWTTYALGWFQQDFGRHRVQYHTGSLPGLIAILGLVPEEQFGVYVFGNLDHAELRHAILWKSIDLFLNKNATRDWHRETFDLYASIKARNTARQDSIKTQRVKGTSPSLELQHYEGAYLNPLYGRVVIAEDLSFQLNTQFGGSLAHWHYDTFSLISRPYSAPSLISFHINQQATISGFHFLGQFFTKQKD